VSGVGDKDNQAFLIAGNALKVNVATNFEVQKSYGVRLRVTDQGGLFFEKSVALGVNNLVEKVSSGVSTTLAPDKDTLELTGTKNIFGMGNQFDNTITGNTGKNKLTGGLGKDILKGGAGVDTFFYNDLKESLLSGFDVITDYSAGEKIISTPFFEGDELIASTGKVSALNADAIGSVANYFKAYGWQPGMPTHFEVDVAAIQEDDLNALLAPDIVPSWSASHLQNKQAVLSQAAMAFDKPLALVQLYNGGNPPSYVAGTENFYVITRYNRSSYYALAVIELGQAVAQAMTDPAYQAGSCP
jgi:Ca2+-binding RTX toxin-like protein